MALFPLQVFFWLGSLPCPALTPPIIKAGLIFLINIYAFGYAASCFACLFGKQLWMDRLVLPI